tara:strand:+ start:224 stop:547 length:324 start_codon:yes stop_codon:yes gene_type:complete
MLHDSCESRVGCEVFYLMRISLEFIEFFLRARPEEDLISQRGKGAIGMTFPKEYYVLPVVPILGLEEGAVGEKVPDIAIPFTANAPDVIDRVVTAVPGRDHVFTGRK